MPVNHVYNNIFSLLALDMSVSGNENVTKKEKEYRRKYPLHTAAKFNLIEMIQFLVEVCFQDFTLKDDRNKTPQLVLETHFGKRKENVTNEERYYRQRYPLHTAAKFNNEIMLKFLVAFCFQEVNETLDDQYQTPLQIAILNGCVDAVELLFPITKISPNNQTCLHMAAQSGKHEIVKYVMKDCPGNVNTRDDYGRTPLHVAVENDELEIIEEFLGRGNDLCDKTNAGKTVFDLVKSENAKLLLIGDEVKQQAGKKMKQIIEDATRSGTSLGSGSFGKVLKVELMPSKHVVAVKYSTNEKSNNITNNEVDKLCKVKHQYCIRMFHGCYHENIFHLFMEFVPGLPLNEYFFKYKLTQKIIKSITGQLVECLCYLKSIKLIHRDIKPENIMIKKDDNCVKLLDFGLAKVTNLFTQTQTAGKGTFCYIAPEIDVDDERAQYSHKVDVYSLGIVFTDMWLGTRAGTFKKIGQDIKDFIDILYMEICKMNGVTEEVKEFFLETVVEDPNERMDPEELRELEYLSGIASCSKRKSISTKKNVSNSDSTVVKKQVKENTLGNRQRVIITAESSKEVTVPFKPYAVTVIEDINNSYTLKKNGELIKSRDGELSGPLIIVGESCLFNTNKLFVYNKNGGYVGYVKLNKKMSMVLFLISWKKDLMFAANKSGINCLNLEGAVFYQTDYPFKWACGLCFVTDKIVAVCDKDDRKVVFIQTEDLSFISSVSGIDAPFSIAKINDSELIVGCWETLPSSAIYSQSSRFYKISNMEIVTEFVGYDRPGPKDMKSLNIDNTVLVLRMETIEHLQINNNSIINYEIIINCANYCCGLMTSHFINNNQLIIICTHGMNKKKLYLHKINIQ